MLNQETAENRNTKKRTGTKTGKLKATEKKSVAENKNAEKKATGNINAWTGDYTGNSSTFIEPQ
jgi:hypothetical protein